MVDGSQLKISRAVYRAKEKVVVEEEEDDDDDDDDDDDVKMGEDDEDYDPEAKKKKKKKKAKKASKKAKGKSKKKKKKPTGSSKYYINDKVAKFDEVATLLKRRGIDLDHNRFLILQGEVEQISLMKPKAATPGETGR